LPETLRHRVAPGCRVLAPFGPRKLTGVVLRCDDDPPEMGAREVLRLLDAQPVLDEELLALGKWIGSYYCAPLGDVLRGMLPLAAEIRRGTIYSLTDAGRDATRQLLLDAGAEDPVTQVLRALELRPLSAVYLAKKLPLADKVIRSLEKRGFIFPEQVQEDRDPLRAPSDRLRVELASSRPEAKLSKPERELVAFLELHPGTHNLKDLESQVRNASPAARSLGRKKAVTLKREPMAISMMGARAPHSLNAPQQA